MAIKWSKTPGFARCYTGADGKIDIQYCQNAVGTPYRVQDWRGPFPVPMTEAMSFHRTLAEAKAWAERNTAANHERARSLAVQV